MIKLHCSTLYYFRVTLTVDDIANVVDNLQNFNAEYPGIATKLRIQYGDLRLFICLNS